MRGALTAIMVVFCAVACGASSHASGCLRVVEPVGAGEFPKSEAFVEAECPAGSIDHAFAYDRMKRVTHAARKLAPGEIVLSYPEFGRQMVRPGERLVLVVVSGPVRIEQTVEALQSAKPGSRLFVKRADGEVISTEYAGIGP